MAIVFLITGMFFDSSSASCQKAFVSILVSIMILLKMVYKIAVQTDIKYDEMFFRKDKLHHFMTESNIIESAFYQQV